MSFGEGDDFASSVLNNPWDGNERRDIGWEENFNEVTAANGIWRGRNGAPNGYVFPLFQGFEESVRAEGLPGDRSLPRFGANRPIDAARYSYLSYRMRHSERTSLAVRWSTAAGSTLGWPDGSQHLARSDADPLGGSNDFLVSFLDLKNRATFEQANGSWSGMVRSLMLMPSFGARTGELTEFDWIRLVDPNSSPRIRLRWSTAGLPPNTTVSLYMDSNVGGYDGTAFYRTDVIASEMSFELISAALPPGTYYLYAVAHVSGNENQVIARTSYSGSISVLAAPSLYFTAPSPVSESDYASERGDPWDMGNPADLANLGSNYPDTWRQFSNPSWDNGVFSATATAPLPGNRETDVQLHMNVAAGAPVDPNRFRYLTYRISVDPSLFTNISDKVARGWVSRIVFWDRGFLQDGGMSGPQVIYEGFHTYTIDLWDPQNWVSGTPLNGVGSVRGLRFDPLEVSVPTRFSVDYFRLSAEPRSAGQYTAHFNIEDPDSGIFDVALYASTSKGGTDVLVGSLSGVGSGARAINWNTRGLPDQHRYYLSAVVSDRVTSRKITSDVPVAIGNVAAFNPTAGGPPDTTSDNAPPRFARVALKPGKKVKSGRKLNMATAITSSSGMRSVIAYVRNSRNRQIGRVRLRQKANGEWAGAWRARTSRSKEKISLRLLARDAKNRRAYKTLKNLSVIR